MKNYPHEQAFSKEKATQAETPKNLRIRIEDYKKMVSQNKIGDGHRGPEGYKCPGSNKK